MKTANTQLIDDIKKTLATVEAADFAEECCHGYEEQAEENQEMVISHLRDALQMVIDGRALDALWCIQEAARCERMGGFESVYTGALEDTYCD